MCDEGCKRDDVPETGQMRHLKTTSHLPLNSRNQPGILISSEEIG